MKTLVSVLLLLFSSQLMAVCIGSAYLPDQEISVVPDGSQPPDSKACETDSDCEILGCNAAHSKVYLDFMRQGKGRISYTYNCSPSIHDKDGSCILQARCEANQCVSHKPDPSFDILYEPDNGPGLKKAVYDSYFHWPEDRESALRARGEQLKLHQRPNFHAPAKNIPYDPAAPIPYKNGMQMAMASVDLTLKVGISVNCGAPGGHHLLTLPLPPGDRISVVAYSQRGKALARIQGRICYVPFSVGEWPYLEFWKKDYARMIKESVNAPNITYPQEPSDLFKTQWWVEVLDGRKKALGWLLVDKNQVRIVE